MPTSTASLSVPPAAASPPRGWLVLEDRFYQRSTQYPSLEWPLTPDALSKAITAYAPNAGPVAVVTDYGWGSNDCVLSIYSISGRILKRYKRLRPLTSIPVRLVGMGWSYHSAIETLSVVYDDGAIIRVRMGDIDEISPDYNVFDNLNHEDIDRIHDTLVLLSGDVLVRTISGTIYRLLPDNSITTESISIPPPLPSPSESPSTDLMLRKHMAAIPSGSGARSSSSNKNISSLILASNGLLYKVGPSESNELDFGNPISQFAVSANGSFLAFIAKESQKLVVSRMEKQRVAEVDLKRALAGKVTNSDKPPKYIRWIGSDAIALFYDFWIVLVGPRGNVVALDIGQESTCNQIICETEVDGIRILTAKTAEFVQLVPNSVSAVFCEEHNAGYKLLRGYKKETSRDELGQDDPLARYELISELRDSDNLRNGARTCAEAALLVENPEEQKALLRATAYAHRFDRVLHKLSEEEENGEPRNETPRKHVRQKQRDEDLVPNAVTSLRIINAVRKDSVGIALTKKQFDNIGLVGLVGRLSQYGEHSMAVKLAAYGEISPTKVLEQWAVAMIRKNEAQPETALTLRIIERFEAVERQILKDSHAISRGRSLPYVSAAEAAFSLKKMKCADLLLRKEHRPAPKVAMYLKMGREAQAVIAAVSSNDSDLVLEVLGKVKRRKNPRDSARDKARLLRTLPSPIASRAIDLFCNHLRQLEEYDAMRLIYLETGRFREAALVDIAHADGLPNNNDRTQLLEKIARNIRRGKHGSTCHFEVYAAQHAAIVSKKAAELEEKAGLQRGSIDRGTNDTELLKRAIHDITDLSKRREMVTTLRRDLHIPDRRFFWVCLEAMAEAGDFDSIEVLSNSAGRGKPPPIGLMPFVDACLRYKQEEEAKKYAERITDLRKKARALARCGYGKEATQLALRLRNPQLQEEIAELVSLHANAL